MDIRPIHTEADYRIVLKEVSALMDSDPEPGTPEGDRLDLLAKLVQDYESMNVPNSGLHDRSEEPDLPHAGNL